MFGAAREEQCSGPASVTLKLALGYPSPTPALTWQEGDRGRGGQNFAVGEAGILLEIIQMRL